MRSRKAIDGDMKSIADELEKLSERRADLQGKIDGLQDIPKDVAVDELATIAEANSEAIEAVEKQIKHITATEARLQERRELLAAESHELEAAKLVKAYISKVQKLYELCERNNAVVDELVEIRKEIGELSRGCSVPSHFQNTTAYQEVAAYPVPTMPANVGQVNLGTETGGPQLKITLPEAAEKAAAAVGG